jgi:hypothetical protein
MKIPKNGFTLFELVWALWAVFCLSLSGLAIWAIVHFIRKFW